MASLNGITTGTNAAAYSVAQELVSTAWNIIFAIVLMAWAFGLSGGKQLVGSAYAGAKKQEEEQRAKRRAKKEAKKEAEAAGKTELST